MARDFTSDDRNKSVFDHNGNRVGTVTGVRDGNGLIETNNTTTDSDSGILDDIKSALGWNDDDDAHELRSDDVDRYDDDGIHLRNL